jgi:hypothetical protein
LTVFALGTPQCSDIQQGIVYAPQVIVLAFCRWYRQRLAETVRPDQMFYAVMQLGKTAEFVAHANGDHSLSRHSRVDAFDVNRRILEWFARYLKPAARSGTPQ